MILKKNDGFTAVELVLVLFFIVLLTTGVVTSTMSWIPEHTVNTHLSKLSATVAAARSKAILGGTDAVLEIDKIYGRYAVLPDAVDFTADMIVIQKLPKELRFAYPPDFVPPSLNMNQTFSAKGILKNDASSKYIYLAYTAKNIYRRLRISPSGKTTIETWDGDSWT